MAVTSVDLDPRLIERARGLTGERSNRAVLDLALRRLIASKQKGTMIDGIAELAELEAAEDELELDSLLLDLLEESEEDELELSELELESSCLLLASLSRSLTLDRTLA